MTMASPHLFHHPYLTYSLTPLRENINHMFQRAIRQSGLLPASITLGTPRQSIKVLHHTIGQIRTMTTEIKKISTPLAAQRKFY